VKPLSWFFQMRENFALRSRGMVKGLEAVRGALKGNRSESAATSQALARHFDLSESNARRLASALLSVGSASRGLQTARSRAESLHRSLGSLVGRVTNLPSLLAAGAVGVTAAVALNAASFKENTLTAFEVMTGSVKEGRRILDEAVKFSSATPFETGQVVDAYQKLLAFQFKPIEVPVVLSAVGDLAALKGFSPEVIDRVTMALGQIKAKGKLQGEEMLQLAESGVPIAKVYELIGKKIGKTANEVRRLQEAGRISADLGIFGVLEAIRTTVSGGPLGNLMQRQSETLTGLISTLKSKPLELFMDLDESGGFKTLKRFIKNINAMLSDDMGATVKKRLQGIFGGLMESIFAPLANATEANRAWALIDGLEARIDAFSAWWRATWPKALATWRQFQGGLQTGLGILRDTWNFLEPGIALLGKLFDGLNTTHAAMGATGGGAVALLGTLTVLFGTWRLLNLVTLGGAGVMGRWVLVAGLTIARMLALRAAAFAASGGLSGLGTTIFKMGRNFALSGMLIGQQVGGLVMRALMLGRAFLTGGMIIGRALLLAMGPISWIIAGVTAIGGALAWLYNRVPAFREFMDGVFGGIRRIGGQLLEWLVSLPARFLEGGRAIVDGIRIGITERWEALKSTVSNLAEGAVGWFKGLLGIKSPSRVFMGLGKQLPAGLELGILSGRSRVLSAISALGAATTMAVASPGVPVGATSAAPSAVVAPVQIVAAQPAPQSAQGSGRVFHVDQINVYLPQGTPREQAQALWEELLQALHETAVQRGLE
jgi:tape measure domain-containing protein